MAVAASFLVSVSQKENDSKARQSIVAEISTNAVFQL